MSGRDDSSLGKNATTTRGKPFARGNSGRPVGARHKTTLAVEALLGDEAQALTRVAIEKALEGDVTALRLCLDRIAPVRRDAFVLLDLPPIGSAADTVGASAALLAAVAAGDVTPDEGSRVMALFTAHRAILETADIETRLAKLEAKA